MKGILLAGGTGTRLMPLTKITNKHLLPVYNKPMIYYPLKTLIDIGIKEIIVVSGKGHAGHFLELLGSGKYFGVSLSYTVQEEAGGIAQALGLCEDFADNEPVVVILGDNIFIDDFKKETEKFQGNGAKVFIKEVDNASRYGVAELNNDKIINIEEKPKFPKSNYCTTGLFMYDNKVFDIIKTLKPSARGELEITDVNNKYIELNKLKFATVSGFWSDAGTFNSLAKSSNKMKELEDKIKWGKGFK